MKASQPTDDIDDEPPCLCMDDDCPACHPECHTCRGDGHVMLGVDCDVWDGINGPYEGEVVKCPNCGGSGEGKDCTYW